jgi:cell fate (sporulation/competence/biofilm development) regulator YlbF (YheA/YmcA/DUF963 family)
MAISQLREKTSERNEVSEGQALQAARKFAAVLAQTPEYQALEESDGRLRRDAAAEEARSAFQAKQRELGWQSRFGLVSSAEQEELRRLQQAMLAQPAIRAYVDAQERLVLLCQEAASLISEVIGLNFSASCGPGCC